MPMQKVHFVHYLATQTIDLSVSKEPQVVALLPRDSEVTSLSVEVIEPADAGVRLDLGYGGSIENLANDINLEQAGAHIANIAFTPKNDEQVKATISGTATKGVFKVRIAFFLPSTYKLELA